MAQSPSSMQGFHELLLPEELEEAYALLREAGLDAPENVTFALGVYEDGVLSGTGFLAGNVVCGIAVGKSRQGEGLAAAIISRLVQEAGHRGLEHLLLFTKPSEAPKFGALGFHLLAMSPGAALLEWGRPDYKDWISGLKALPDGRVAPTGQETEAGSFPLGSVVMNANPFTTGHRHLVVEALKHCARLLVFVVREDASAFPFAIRLRLVREGLQDIDRVTVVPGGPYMVSRASFPAYFTGKVTHSRIHAELDCTMFAERIAPDLGISARFVGEEPYCPVTAGYNAVMREILPLHGIACLEIPRLAVAGSAVSASTVRALLRQQGGDAKIPASLVPPSTAAWLVSAEAGPVLGRLREEVRRH